MYRPTVRYEDVYKEYVENVFHATHLDRSQIIRAALFIAGHTEQFSRIIEPYIRRGMSLPSPLWNEEDEELWLNQKVVEPMEVRQVTKEIQKKPVRVEKRRVEEQPLASPKVFSPGGGVSITFGGSHR
ncbi:hypothetical protein [Halalkalibacter alkalisediminis]|uniref:Uncharacterized protein n=1 Tax=Halalkalibacter alkalisediminis TaxID=935616 RepID=A0ABV6NJ41_9BACI|nr:hypothetical protein [Halalkalibacter alkalisediminis]